MKRKIFVVDDSALMRKIISDMINEETDMEVIEKVRNGEDLFEKLKVKQPDLITLDIEMPKMNGIDVIHEMNKRKIDIPVIVLSSISERAKRLTIDCLHGGAFDFIEKPSGSISLDINKVKETLVTQIRAALSAKINYRRTVSSREIRTRKPLVSESRASLTAPTRGLSKNKEIKAVAIGASTGGPKALHKVLTQLPFRIGVPVFVVQHMPIGFTKAFAERLDANCKMKVVEAYEGCPVESDTIYIARGGKHMIVKNKRVSLSDEPAIWGVKPAVDKLFDSVAKEYGEKVLSVVLTGMGKDGAMGTVNIKEAGGYTCSEAKETCTIYGMPKATFETGRVDEVVQLDLVADKIISMTRRRRI